MLVRIPSLAQILDDLRFDVSTVTRAGLGKLPLRSDLLASLLASAPDDLLLM